MSVVAMKRITICGLRDDRKAVLEEVQRQGVVEVHGTCPEDEVFAQISMPITESEFDRNINDAESALDVLAEYVPVKSGLLSSFKGRTIVDVARYDGFRQKMPQIQAVIRQILDMSKTVAENKAEIVRCRQQIDTLTAWKTLDIPLDTSGTEQTGIFIGVLPQEQSLDSVYEILAPVMPADVTIFSKDKTQTCLMVICQAELKEQTFGILRSAGFAFPAVSSHNTPSEQIHCLEQEIKERTLQNEETGQKIAAQAQYREDIQFYADYMSIRAEKYNVTNSLPQSEHTFVLEGYIPARSVKSLEKALEFYDLSIETEDPAEDEDVPVLLHNNAFTSSIEGVVAAYSLPGKGEIDPSFLISLFYFVFFGFMLADIGIGAIIVLATGILLLRNPNMERGTKDMMKLLFFGGISTIFFGVLFGSCFGDVIPVVSGSFFGNEITLKPLWLDMAAHPMTVLSLALVMGIIHIYVALGAAGYQYLKKKDLMGFFFQVIVWYVVLTGLLLKCLSMQMIMDILGEGRPPVISAQTGQVGLIAAGIGCVFIIFMSEYKTKSWPKRIMKGLYGVYGITSYLSDILSYSRLLALGLATGVISSVANMIGTMFGNGAAGVIIFIIVFVIINAINLGINTLGAYVHTNRLQYVEFFGHFYDGGGRAFEPYSIKTKYYKFKENAK